MKHLLKLILSAAGSLATISYFLPNVTYQSWGILFVTAVVLVLIQVIIKPILNILLLPLTIITLGLFRGIITIFLFWLAINIVPGFHIDPMIVEGYHLGLWGTLIVVGILVSWVEAIYFKILSVVLG